MKSSAKVITSYLEWRPTDKPSQARTFYWMGHVHPMMRLERGPDRIRLPAFVIAESQGLLPAFS